MKARHALAISGGIDSLLAGWLLKQKGFRLHGLHFINGYQPATPSPQKIAAQVQARLDIPVDIVDLQHVFEQQVVDYFCRSYQNGRTPNPCLVCNSRIKFGAMLDAAQERGLQGMATGHYAQVTVKNGRTLLKKGVDQTKDQAYFLARLKPAQLKQAVFPLGAMTKTQVLALAQKEGLVPPARSESQDICFVPPSGYGTFLAKRQQISQGPGSIYDLHGHRLGTHPGLEHFTIGQRRGINCPASQPYYVVAIDTRQNRLIVGGKKDLQSDGCTLRKMNWLLPPSPPLMPCHAQIRYHHKPVPAMVKIVPDRPVTVCFASAQNAVAPGQAAVLYQDEVVLGAGWIETALKTLAAPFQTAETNH